MRKYLVLVLIAIVAFNCYGQKLISGTFSVLSSEKAVCIKWNFSSTVFEKKFDERSWAATKGVDEWNKAKAEAMAVILYNVNKELRKTHIFVVNENSGVDYNYSIVISPIVLDSKGNNKSDYLLVDKDNKEIARIQIKGDGGHWGDLGNLLGDGYEEAARKLGKHIKKNVK